ncbi:MAG: CusA/CzcA family heavy metal efflux RND transporter [Saccharospirillaceae bacterium]|nr:CusA/CzcA family heavy metal efflux RND transporter [Saccharospirillaceae bacterium]MCD8531742.1 CusA/CzcA family heavy metal efflux RND transporter [Saccharospirillaceae bacterium]
MFTLLTRWAVANRLLVLIAITGLSIAAAFALPKLNLDAFPDVTNVQVAINTEAPGLAAEEVEKLITYPIEAVMYALPGVAEVRSISKTGLSGITVVFNEGTDVYFARQLVFERLQAAREFIPQGAGIPEMGPNTSGLGQIFQYVLLAEPGSGYDLMQLRSLNDWLVKLLLMPVDGVTDVLSFGGDVRQYQVNMNPDRLLAFQLSQQDVIDALEANNRNVGGWYLNRGQEQLVIRGTGWLDSGEQGLQQLAQIPLRVMDGVAVTVADVAEVSFGSEIRQGAVTFSRQDGANNGGEVVSGIVLKRMGANTKATIDGIQQRLALIQQALPAGVTFEVIYDQAGLIEQAVNTVVNALALAFVFILIVLALFMMNVRATLLVLISIPLSIIIALMLMSWYGLSANLMSLGGIAVAIGMLVDGSVVMVENMFRHLQNNPDASQGNIRLRIQEAAAEVARPVFFATGIILLVFLPLFGFEGVEAKLFQPMAISIMLAMLVAVLVALIVVPALATFMFRAPVTNKTSPLLQPLEKQYRHLLTQALRFPRRVMLLAGTLLLAALIIAPRLGTEFVPELEEGTINLRVTLAPSASLETALSVAPKLEALLLQFPEVNYAMSRIGRPELGGDPEPVSNIEIYIGLKPRSEWQSANDRQTLQRLMEEKLEVFPGLLFNFSQPISTRVDELLSGVRAQLAIKLFGPDLDVLAQQGQQIETLVKTIAGTRDVAMEQIAGEAQLVITPDRDALSRYGLSVDHVLTLVRDGLGGSTAGQIINGNERYDIYVRLQQEFRNSAAAIADLRLRSPSGAIVRLGDVATVEFASGPPQVRRDDVQRRLVIQANVEGRDMGSVVADIRNAIDTQMQLPPGYAVSIGGQFENQQRAQQRLMMIVPLSLGFIALLLYFAFGSVGQALLILLNVPLAVIGGIFSLWLSGQYLSVPGSVGFITLFGVAVLNGVVMVESINQRIAAGHTLNEAVFDGALSRLRPVLMTALTSALGLIPMLMSNGLGAEIQKPLASVIVGGLITATFLTLFILPLLYPFFSQWKLRGK